MNRYYYTYLCIVGTVFLVCDSLRVLTSLSSTRMVQCEVMS